MSLVTIAAEAWVLTHLSPPYLTAGCMVLSTCSRLDNDRGVLMYLVSQKYKLWNCARCLQPEILAVQAFGFTKYCLSEEWSLLLDPI